MSVHARECTRLLRCVFRHEVRRNTNTSSHRSKDTGPAMIRRCLICLFLLTASSTVLATRLSGALSSISDVKPPVFPTRYNVSSYERYLAPYEVACRIWKPWIHFMSKVGAFITSSPVKALSHRVSRYLCITRHFCIMLPHAGKVHNLHASSILDPA